MNDTIKSLPNGDFKVIPEKLATLEKKDQVSSTQHPAKPDTDPEVRTKRIHEFMRGACPG